MLDLHNDGSWTVAILVPRLHFLVLYWSVMVVIHVAHKVFALQ